MDVIREHYYMWGLELLLFLILICIVTHHLYRIYKLLGRLNFVFIFVCFKQTASSMRPVSDVI